MHVEALEERCLLSVITVIGNGDGVGVLTPTGSGTFTDTTLRGAITAANSMSPGTNTINFQIGSGLQTISPTSALPTITNAVIIDGYSQLGSSPNTLACGDNAVLLIEVSGATLPGGVFAGLTISAGNSTVQGLLIDRFPSFGFGSGGNGIAFVTNGGNTVTGNFITGNFGEGVLVTNGASGNTIGGTALGARNVLSGNVGDGVDLETGGNQVLGNFIGTDATGTNPQGNGGGVFLRFGGSNNVIGGTAPGAGNVISSNANVGLFFQAVGGNLVQGNFIGTDCSGTLRLGNRIGGMYLFTSSGNTIGGTLAAARNVISGNTNSGVVFDQSSNNLLQGNYIGTDKSGTGLLGNTGDGVFTIASANTIGGSVAGAGNVISGNARNGVEIYAANSNVVQGNYIGTDAAGTTALGNTLNGVNVVNGGSGNLIGGTAAGAGNVISSNGVDGVGISNVSSTTVQGNFIGTNAAGTAGLANVNDGVHIVNAINNTIGGTTLPARNVISANAQYGVEISGTGVTGNVVLGNFIGTDFSGNFSLGNVGGVRITANASNNTIGGAVSGAANVIATNQLGITIDNGAFGNQVQGNFIGTNSLGAILGNQYHGVYVHDSSSNTVGGTASGARNTISTNGLHGVFIQGNATGNLVLGNYLTGNVQSGAYVQASNNTIGGTSTAARNLISGNGLIGVVIEFGSNNVVQGNFIGTDATGTLRVGNNVAGVFITNASNNLIGGTVPGARNIISGNGVDGILLRDNSQNNLVQGNYLGTDVSGVLAVPNGQGVEIIYGPSNNTIGGTDPAARNVISGNSGSGIIINSYAAGDFVQGNYIGLKANGVNALGNGGPGVYLLNTSGHTIGGTASGAGNVIAANGQDGVLLTNTANIVVQGNFIGTNAAGTAGLPNVNDGVHIVNAINNTIGGTTAGAGNLISSNFGNGCEIDGANGNVLQRNFIGTDVTGTTALGNGRDGVRLQNGAQMNQIGGPPTGDPTAFANTIAFNRAAGVVVGANASDLASKQNAVRGNAISSNGRLGIDLGADGVTPNDPCDVDAGPNNSQNFPVLEAAVALPSNTTRVVGRLNSVANTTFTIDFYASPVADPSGFGQGQRYLGFVPVTTNPGCNVAFTVTLPAVPAGWVITATATDLNGNTSEFSQAVIVQAAQAPGGGSLPSLSAADSADGEELPLVAKETRTGALLLVMSSQAAQVTPAVQTATEAVAPRPAPANLDPALAAMLLRTTVVDPSAGSRPGPSDQFAADLLLQQRGADLFFARLVPDLPLERQSPSGLLMGSVHESQDGGPACEFLPGWEEDLFATSR